MPRKGEATSFLKIGKKEALKQLFYTRFFKSKPDE